MKQLIPATLFIAAITCSNMQSGNFSIGLSSLQRSIDNTTIAGIWHLLPALASDTAAGKIPELNFDVKTNKFSGNTGCNAINGSFILQGDALSFGENMVSTKMACPGYNEKTFLESLLKTNRYVIKNGVLQLMYNTTVLSQWVRHADTTVTKQI